ncbi:MAG: PfaD family polyunsaturated fatty acid/polyketide biosynthesis protein [Thermodesulfobacteriota bacterium]
MTRDGLGYVGITTSGIEGWECPAASVAFDEPGIYARLLALDKPCFAVREGTRIGLSNEGICVGPVRAGGAAPETLAWTAPLPAGQLGDDSFRKSHGTRFAYYTGAMANGIASEEMIIALGREGLMGSFGAAGLLPARVAEAISRIQKELPEGPYAFNLIHSPNEPALERECVELYLTRGVRCVEAAAYLDLTPQVVLYRVAGLEQKRGDGIEIKNRLIAKVSRKEVATKFMEPAPPRLLQPLVDQGRITEEQARLAGQVPMADDITAEADSAGHTDNRPMLALLPSMLSLRDEIQEKYGYEQPVRVGAAGGIGTPTAALAAFIMGAAYVVTGSVNQGCVESGASEHSKALLAEADMADVMMAPAADMFEMGVKLQVLKRGTLFPMRAQKLYELYNQYESIDEIPVKEREKLEKQIFRSGLEEIWESTAAYFAERDPVQIERAASRPKRKMALIFRWYLGLSSSWSNEGTSGREMDYQIWCGPSMGAFNAWARGSHLEEVKGRKVADVAKQILTGAAYSYRVQNLATQGVRFPPNCLAYRPRKM